MATHSSALAWRIPWREEPGGLQSTGLQIVGHDWATSLSLSSLENITNIYLKMQSPHTLAGLCNICYCCCSVTESYTTHCNPMNYIQHTILPCPSLFPRVCLNSCPLSWWWTTIHPSVSPFSSCLQSFPASGSFPMSQFFASNGQSIRAAASVLPMNIKVWLTGLISMLSKGLSRIFSSTTVQKHQFFSRQPSLWSHICVWLLEKQ